MRCRRCRQIGHNVRKCTMAAGTMYDETVNAGTVNAGTLNAGTVNAGTVNARTMNAGTVNPKRTRRNRCGHCGELGHTARTCLIRRGVQAAVVDPNTTRRVRRREERAVLGGVGVYNTKRRATCITGTSTSRRHAEQEEIGPSQPPPGTQPSQ
ncbi:hypothetical protein LINGRAHAP2_LOCUS15337 [Linum grandiflorum]